jgi:hypothetical protein
MSCAIHKCQNHLGTNIRPRAENLLGISSELVGFRNQILGLLGVNLPPIVFPDAQITKRHDLLPMVLFLFRHIMSLFTMGLQNIESARAYLRWFAYICHLVLLNEAMFSEDTSTHMRLIWLKVAYFIFVTIQTTYKQTGFEKRI